MLKYFRVGLPFVIVLMCILNIIAAYGVNNSMAMNGYIMALCGWLALTFDEFLTFRKEKRIENATNSIT